MLKRTILAAVLAAFLPGCAQDYAGITRIQATFGDDGKPRSFDVWQGKEGDFNVTANMKTGAVTWVGRDVRAFGGQRARAEVGKALAEAGANVAPAALDIILKTLGGL